MPEAAQSAVAAEETQPRCGALEYRLGPEGISWSQLLPAAVFGTVITNTLVSIQLHWVDPANDVFRTTEDNSNTFTPSIVTVTLVDPDA